MCDKSSDHALSDVSIPDVSGCTQCVTYLQRIQELENILSGHNISVSSDIKLDEEKENRSNTEGVRTRVDTREGVRARVDTREGGNSSSSSESEESFLDLSERRIEELVDQYYTVELFNQGQKGIISFIYSYIVRSDDDQSKILYKCIDQNKRIFRYRDEEGLHRDVKGKIIMDAIYDPLLKKVNKLYRIMINRIYEDEKNSGVLDEEDSDDYDSDVEEVIAAELHFVDDNSDITSTDDKVNNAVNRFLEIKKCCGKIRKPIIDELSQLLFI